MVPPWAPPCLANRQFSALRRDAVTPPLTNVIMSLGRCLASALMAAHRSAKVVLYHARACHLCERARRIVAEVRGEIPFDLEEVEIDGDPALEARYREWLPVVEIDGERAFVYYVDPDAFRRKLAAQS
jgi:glutaredoxin